jgi:hypothetical protein
MAATTTALLTAVQGAGAITTAVGAIGQASAQRAQGRIANTLARSDARRLRAAAEEALIFGQETAERRGLVRERQLGAQTAAIAASGIQVGSGSAQAVVMRTAITGAVDIDTIRVAAGRRALGFESQALQAELRGELALIEAKAKSTQTLVAGAAQLSRDVVGITDRIIQDPFFLESSRPVPLGTVDPIFQEFPTEGLRPPPPRPTIGTQRPLPSRGLPQPLRPQIPGGPPPSRSMFRGPELIPRSQRR